MNKISPFISIFPKLLLLIAPPCSATLFLNNIFPFVSIVPPLLIAPPLIALLFINVLFIIIKCPLFSIAPPFFISAVLLSNIQSIKVKFPLLTIDLELIKEILVIDTFR